MKAVLISVATKAKANPRQGSRVTFLLRRVKTWLFGFVEGDLYTYAVKIRNVGDEAVSSKDLLAIQFRWEFPTHQANIKGWLDFSERLEPNQELSFPEVDHHVLSSGFALLYVHTLREVPTLLGNPPLEIVVLDSTGQPVPFEPPTSMIRISKANIRGETQSTLQEGRSSSALESFRSLTSQEVKQSVLIVIAVVGLLLSGVFGVLNYLK